MLRNFTFWLSTKKAFTGPIARTGMRLGFAKRFIAGETLEDALGAAAELEARGMLTMLNRLGEYVNDRREAEGIYENYIQMLDELAARKLAGTISIKPTQLGLLFDAALCHDLALRVVAHAASLNRFVEVDMEDSASVDAT